MRKLMVGVLAACAAAVTAQADGELFRYSADGSGWTAAETLAEAIEGVPAGGIVELTGDATYDTEITITKNVTIRSAEGATYTLKRTEPVTIMVGNGGAANVTVTNLVWDGGAVWTYSHEDANSEATYRENTGVANAVLVKTQGAWRNIAELHLVNVKVTNAYSMYKGTVIDAGQYANLWLETGTLVTDCRGDYIVYQSSSDNDVYFDGECEIVGNFARTAVFFNANTSDTQYYHFRACTVTNNVTQGGGTQQGYPLGYAFIMSHYVRGHIRVGKPTEEGGRVIFRDNFRMDKTTEMNIIAPHHSGDSARDGRFVLEGSLTADSEVRVMPDTIGDTIADGSVIGSLASGVESFRSVSRIVTDAAWTGEKMYACVKNGMLVWSAVPQKDTFVSDDFDNAYSSLAEAVAATPDGGRLWLSGTIPAGEDVVIAGKSLKLDLNGRSLGASASVVLGEKGGLTLVDSKLGEVAFDGTVEVSGADANLHLGPGVYTGSPAVRFTESAKDASFYAGGATFVSTTGAALEFAGTGDWDLGGTTVTGADGVKVWGGTLTMNDASVDVTGTGVLCDKGANAVEVRQDNETAVVKGGVAAYATTAAFDAAVAAGTAYGDVSGGSVSSVVPSSLLDGYACAADDDGKIVFTPVGNAVRFSDDGGESWVEYGSFDDFMDIAARTSHTTTNWVVELLRDCKVSKMVTWSSHASDCWIVIRSDSRQGHRHVLQIAAEGAKRMFVVQNNTHVFDLRFGDVVLDGGAVYSQRWLDPSKSRDELLAHGGVTIDNGTVFNLNGAGGYAVVFGKGSTVRNFCGTAFAATLANTVLEVEEGSRLTGMRINGVMFSRGSYNSSGCFQMEGGRIDHCYFVGNGGLCSAEYNGSIGLHLNGGEITENLFTTYMLYADGRVDFTGTRIVGNTCQRNSTSYEETYSICWIPNKSGAGYEVSGNPVCWDNYNLAGLNVGLSAQAKPIIVTGALERGARVRFMCPNGQNLVEGGVVSHDGAGPSYILNGVDPRGLSHIYNTQTDFAKDVCWVAKRSDVDMLDGTAKKLVYTKPSVCLVPGMVKSAASSTPTLFLTQISRDLKAGRLDVTGTLTLTDTVLELGADVGTLENFKGGVMIPLATAAEIVGFDAFSAANVAALDLPRHWSLQVLPTHDGRQQLCLCRQKQGLMLFVR